MIDARKSVEISPTEGGERLHLKQCAQTMTVPQYILIMVQDRHGLRTLLRCSPSPPSVGEITAHGFAIWLPPIDIARPTRIPPTAVTIRFKDDAYRCGACGLEDFVAIRP